MKNTARNRDGLILLVVLGMLSLFSLLAISFMVVSSQSRASNFGRARRDFRGTPPTKLLDSAVRTVLRGTRDVNSTLYRHDLLGDIYGHGSVQVVDPSLPPATPPNLIAADPPIELRVRQTRFGLPQTNPSQPPQDSSNSYPPMTLTSDERPLLLASRFLRIPVVCALRPATPLAGERPMNDNDYNNPTYFNPVLDLPRQSDAWTSRIATFTEGPLRGQSFRVVRYIGDPRFDGGTVPAGELAQNYSIVIDLQDAASGMVTVGGVTRSLADWANRPPLNELELCYSNVNNGQLSGGYGILLNAAPLNSHGHGITGLLPNPSPPDPLLSNTTQEQIYAQVDPSIRSFPQALQPQLGRLQSSLQGDSDESYDAADFQNMWLSHRKANAASSDDIIPSFHRAALINYIVSLKDPRDYENGELHAVVTRILRATGRPLSVRVFDDSFPDGQPRRIEVNPNFTGGNSGDYTFNVERTPQLDVAWTGQSDWQNANNPTGYVAFLDWVRWLTRGPWDVDSDADGIYDGVWTDPNLPLITSREGKLLKALVSYTIESMDSRLDLNAAGSLIQAANYAGTVAGSTVNAAYTLNTNDSYAQGANQFVPQGLGYGPGDISLRHLFQTDRFYAEFLASRYTGTWTNPNNGQVSTETVPGIPGGDIRSLLDLRELRPGPISNGVQDYYRHGLLPAMPMSSHGRVAVGLDRMGNPLMLNTDALDINNQRVSQPVNRPYELRLLDGSHSDNIITLAEWEKATRPGDWDRSSLPRRMQNTLLNRYAAGPRSRHMRHPPLAPPRTAGATQKAQSHSMFDVVQDMYVHNPPSGGPASLTYAAYRELFPIEFQRGQGLNVNRPLGNGWDDDDDGNVDEIDEALKNAIDDDGDGNTDELDERQWRAYQQRTITSVQGQAPSTVNLVEEYLPGQITIGGTTYQRGIFEGNLDPAFEALAVAARTNDGSDTDGDGQTDGDTLRYHFGQQSRQLLARNLYCLAMLILPEELYLANQPAALTGDDRARRLAQWAVNVVDFRDADSAMTRFPYDPDPFGHTAAPYWVPNTSAGEVVWGQEQQDLAITESLAFHDLRVKDTADDDDTGTMIDTANPASDQTQDQYRLPEGSAFFELLALRTTSGENDQSAAGVSRSLYFPDSSNNMRLDLSAVSPSINVNGTATVYPVYRIAISAPHDDPLGNPTTPLGIQAATSERPFISYQLSRSQAESGLAWDTRNLTQAAPFEIDRVVVFTQPRTDLGMPDLPASVTTPGQIEARIFWNHNGSNISLAGGQYLVVGPRQVTYFGSRTATTGHEHLPNPHRIELGSGSGTTPAAYADWASVFGTDAGTENQLVPNFRTAMRSSVTMIAAQDALWAAQTPAGKDRVTSIGLNVSAPYQDQYYMAPSEPVDSGNMAADTVTSALGFGDANQPVDGYYDFGLSGTSTGLPDVPFDSDPAVDRPLSSGSSHSHQWKYRSGSDEPEPGTQENWCTAFLQRLADPSRPWHRAFNPYITIDWIPVDLTVFSGDEDIPDTTIAGGEFKLATRQKTGAMIDPSTGNYPVLTTLPSEPRTFLSYHTTELLQTSEVTTSSANFKHELRLDWDPTLAPRPTDSTPASAHFATLGYLNSTFGLSGETGGTTVPGYVGAPTTMPAGLFWADRPFANPLELMLVPTSGPGQLMQELSAPLIGAAGDSPYATNQSASVFTQLPNFFQQVLAQDGTPANNQLSGAVLMELLETPSPWSDAEDFVPPADIVGGTGSPQQQAIQYIFRPIRAPYNRLDRHLEPGRVNINDISEPDVWQGLMWNAMNPGNPRNQSNAAVPFWQELLTSRAGYNVNAPTQGALGTTSNPHLDSTVPTQFGGVFKAAFSAGMVPPTPSNTVALDPAARESGSGQVINPAGVTLMRSDFTTPSEPLFDRSYPASSVLTTRHPFMEFLPITRLSNLTTTRSNVFSVRVTIGFFEYDPSTGLGQEYGIDEGTAMRHRGFYLIDRSIPVGYREGYDLNTDKCIIMRRVIE